MTEKQKRDNGELYYAGKDSDFLDEVIRAKDLCYAYNQIRPTDFKAQHEILEKLLGKIGDDSVIYPPFWCDYGYNIEMGKGCLANHGLTVLDGAKVRFGDNVLIGPGCYFHTAGHPIDPVQRKPSPLPWETTSGSAPASTSCPGSPSATTPSSEQAAS